MNNEIEVCKTHYFECERLKATITINACEINQAKKMTPMYETNTKKQKSVQFLCKGCAGHGGKSMITAEEMHKDISTDQLPKKIEYSRFDLYKMGML